MLGSNPSWILELYLKKSIVTESQSPRLPRAYKLEMTSPGKSEYSFLVNSLPEKTCTAMHSYMYIPYTCMYTQSDLQGYPKRYCGILAHTVYSKVVTGASVHWTYSSSSSSAISERDSRKHRRNSILSAVGLVRFLVNHGGLLRWQHVPPPSQTWPSQSGAFG